MKLQTLAAGAMLALALAPGMSAHAAPAPAPVKVATVALSAATVVAGKSVIATVTLTHAASAPASIMIRLSPPIAMAPFMAVVPVGSNHVCFPVTAVYRTGGGGTTNVCAGVLGQTGAPSATLTITAAQR